MSKEEQVIQEKCEELNSLLKVIECTIEKQIHYLEIFQRRKLARMIKENEIRIEKACLLKKEIDTMMKNHTSIKYMMVLKELNQSFRRIQLKITQNMKYAHTHLESSRKQLQTIKSGQKHVINGYLKTTTQSYGYYIDKRTP